jgi:hypothetical protein
MHTYIIVTDMEDNIRIDRLPKPKGSLYILILHYISVTIVFIALKTII